KRLELDTDGEPTLELGNEVRWLADVERAGGDEEHVVRLHRPVLGGDGAALDDGEDVALHALAAGDLVDLVDEDDAGGLGADQRLAVDAVLIHQTAGLLLRKEVQ